MIYSRKSHPVEYNIWGVLRNRCHNSTYSGFQKYGARGITVSDRWFNSFHDFMTDVGPRPSVIHSLDRIDDSRVYGPGMVRWATPEEQARNRTNNIHVTFGGETKLLQNWCEETGTSYSTVYGRIHRGWSPEAALYLPPHTRPGHIERDCAKAWEKCFPNGSGDCYLR